jgi:outer membrane protein assembly factor BamA
MKKSIGNFRLGLNNANEPGYNMLAPTTSVTYGYNFTRRFSGTITAALSNPSYENKTDVPYDFPDNPGYVGWFETRLTRDGTNDRVAPTKGSFTWLRFEWGPAGGVSEINWIRVEVNGSYMFPVKATGVAVNARVGWGKPIAPATMLLPDRRFYAGGSMANRGFHRHRLGPKDSQGLPVGGEVLALGFVEYRFPIAWKFQGAAFVDLGQVWQTNDDVTIRNVEVSVGPALRVLTPVGPLRLDWGFRLTNYDTTEPSSAFHFAIGYPM